VARVLNGSYLIPYLQANVIVEASGSMAQYVEDTYASYMFLIWMAFVYGVNATMDQVFGQKGTLTRLHAVGSNRLVDR
jgi:hypothetical protein